MNTELKKVVGGYTFFLCKWWNKDPDQVSISDGGSESQLYWLVLPSPGGGGPINEEWSPYFMEKCL